MAKKSKYEVPVKLLRWRCNPKSLGVRSTNDIESSREIIGQDRALRALRMGLEMKHNGYNVFVSGYTGTGRMTMIKQLLAEFEHKVVPLRDHCYLYNFHNVDQPMLVSLPAGMGAKLCSDLDDLLQELKKNIPSAFDSRRFQEEKKKLLEHFQARQRTVLKDFEKKVKDKGFEVVQVQSSGGNRPDIAPVVGNQPVSYDQLDSMVQQGMLTKQQVDQIIVDRGTLESSMEIVLREMRNIDRKAKDSLDDLNRRYIAPMVKAALEELTKKYNNERLTEFFKDLEEEVMGDLDRFRPMPEDAKGNVRENDDPFLEFAVNVLVDNSETKGIPIIIETNPKYKNLFGTIEREIDKNGTWRTDFTLIKPGSILAADGGFLVINALDALAEAGVWQSLKRTLRNRLLEIQSPDNTVGASSALKPESIPIDVKVVLIGDAMTYYVLYDQDDDFKKIFKVRADFDVEMMNEQKTIRQYMSFVKLLVENNKLLPFAASGIAAVIEHGARIAGRQNKLTTRFNEIADLARESSYWASKADATMVSADHVLKAVHERTERVKMVEDKVQELIIDKTIFIDTEGMVVGQVNGLSVYDMGDHVFGRPARITVRTALGRQGIINIEREASLSGPSHNKGVLILSGFLRSMYAQSKPLALSASIAFEQSYSGIDGDSASSTEVYAILSSIANVPLRQDIAVTGSINQKGEIQPIGGVNEKIEGFFEVCRSRGLTGTQGVMIPATNIPELMLRQELIAEVEKGRFHIYAIRQVDEGIELLTGMKAGKRLPDGTFEKGSVHYLVDEKLREYALRWKEIARD